MGVDVVDAHASRLAERTAHCGLRPPPFIVRRRRMIRIARRAVSSELGDDSRTARRCIVPSLENEIRRTFAEGDAFAIGVKGRTWIRIDRL